MRPKKASLNFPFTLQQTIEAKDLKTVEDLKPKKTTGLDNTSNIVI